MVDGKHATDIKTKVNIFNEYFAEQCTFLKNSSVFLINETFWTQSSLTSLDFNEEEILKIIRALSIHKAPGHDDISIRMIKICDKLLSKPWILLFQNSAKLSYFPDISKRSNIIPVHKKNDKEFVKNYRTISLLGEGNLIFVVRDQSTLIFSKFLRIFYEPFRIFYEPEDARWSSSKKFVNFNKEIDTTFTKNETSRIIVYIETICPN